MEFIIFYLCDFKLWVKWLNEILFILEFWGGIWEFIWEDLKGGYIKYGYSVKFCIVRMIRL